MVIFTSICSNYLHKARTLAKSVKENISDSKFLVCLVEDSIPQNASYEYFDEIVLAKDAWEGNFERFIFKHSIVEASTSVKGQFFRYLYKKFPNESQFVYLDPDTYVYSDFIELKELLKDNPIVLCPHLLQPGNIDMELSSTAHGVYNLGFLGVNSSEEAQKFINWWADRLFLFCYDDMGKGIFTDQKWVDLAPCFFNVLILKHRGYDFAPWSLLNCGMTEENDKIYIQGDPLRFIHFSGYGATAEKCMREWLPEGNHPFKKLYQEYSLIHDANNYDNVSQAKWTYSCYKSGEKISQKVREKYRASNEIMYLVENPFEKSNAFYNKLNLKRTRNHNRKIAQYYQKVINTYNQEGIHGVIKKTIHKLTMKN
ncbi:hypothetical protein DW089_08860 [Acidaminococcus sp. AM05-11]|uniref:hypothetical protein n=1 Tax=Acidaminococcus sp. AM05-11 TaxID=2291997 RepID=UPI000E4F406A|nr:hypothetical protein [Acidaminococcus sp. AM05-11]RHK00938.1 hypothetical protein DW089_08860 [Acidaminococcus sp. AM05-11]